MPSYKNRKPLDPETQIWHYTNLDAVKSMWRKRQISLSRVDTFEDKFEGSVPQKQIDDQLLMYAGRTGYAVMTQSPSAAAFCDLWEEMTQRRRAMTRSAHAICWCHGHESEAMWKLFCKDPEKLGPRLALRSTLGKLEESVIHENVYVSPLEYRLYHEGVAFNNDLDPLFHKRQGFSHEQEVRIVMYDAAHHHKLSQFLIENPTDALPHELEKYRFLDWSPATCVEAITISPYASEAEASAARSAIADLDPKVDIELSILSELRYPANF